MVKFLLLALTFGLAHAQTDGPWKTIAIAADNVDKIEISGEDKIEISGELRLYFHQITCEKECKKMNVTFYVNENGQCSLTTITGYLQDDGNTYRSQFQGDNHYATVRTTPENIVFYSENVDRAGRKTKLVYVVGSGHPLTLEQKEKIVEYAKENNIPPGNIREVLTTDYCPR